MCIFQVGDRVRVKPHVTTPKYKWGSVTHRSVGLVSSISPNGRDSSPKDKGTHLWLTFQYMHQMYISYPIEPELFQNSDVEHKLVETLQFIYIVLQKAQKFIVKS